MPFEKGKISNPRGRKKGTVNRNNAELKNCLRQFLSGNIDKLQKSFDELEKPELKLKFIMDAWKLLLPEPLSLNRLSPEDMKELFDFIKTELQNESKN